MSLIMINEGRNIVCDFFIENGVKPAQAIFDLECFDEAEPFIKNDDIILIVIHGFTDFHKAGLVQLLDKMADNDNIEYDNIIILSDMMLSGIKHEYYLYEGNVFKSKLKVVRGKSIYDEEEIRGREKDIINKQGAIEKIKLYSCSEKCMILESNKGSKALLSTNEDDDSLYGSIKVVDIFKGIKE